MNSAELPLCHHEYPDRTVCRLPKGHDSNTHGDPTEQPKADIPLVITDADLHPDTARLVTDFAQALADKLLAAEMKYGYSNGWMNWDWMDECRDKLREHLAKGDPRDVAAYCAFLWFHGEPTAKKTEQAFRVTESQIAGMMVGLYGSEHDEDLVQDACRELREQGVEVVPDAP